MQLIRAIACAGVSIRWLPQPAWSFPVGRIHCCCGRSAGAAALVYALCSCRTVKQGPRARRVGVYETTGGRRGKAGSWRSLELRAAPATLSEPI